MPQSVEAVEKAVTPMSFLGSHRAKFTFARSATSTRTAVAPFNAPQGTLATTIALEGFDLKYSNKNQFGFGELQISLRASNTEATCTATVRDNNVNQREWEGTVEGLVTFFGRA